MKEKNKSVLWSATPTPFREDLTIDQPSVEKMVDLHAGLGVDGIMLGGSCGEGPWMPTEDLEELVRVASRHSAGRMPVAAQVTDNSAARMLRHIDRMAAAGADYAVIAAPYFMMNATAERILGTYCEVVEQSALPVIYYDRGKGDRYRMTDEQLPVLLRMENLAMVKDSSLESARASLAMEVRNERSGLTLMTGDEFGVADAVVSGMDGGFLGGAIFNAPCAKAIIDAAKSGDVPRAQSLQKGMNEFMLTVYGGPQISAWLTGLKYFLGRLGVFSTVASYLGYPLSDEVREGIDSLFQEPGWSQWVLPLEEALAGGSL